MTNDPWEFRPPEDFKLWGCQTDGVAFLVRAKKACLGDEMGAGKALQVLQALVHYKPRKLLLLGTKTACYTWNKEIKKWYPGLEDRIINIKGTIQRKQRLKLWEQAIKSEDVILVCTYGTFRADIDQIMKIYWNAMAADEVHKPGLKNRKTILWNLAKKMLTLKSSLGVPIIYFMSGSLASRGVQDMWAYIYLLRPKLFPSYWKFINTFCIVDDNGFGKEIIGQQNMDQFRKLTENFILRRKKKDIRADMPDKLRVLQPLELEGKQLKMYKKLAADMVLKLTDGTYKMASTSLAKDVRLRQLLVCPKIIDPEINDYGQALEWILEHIDDTETFKTAIFCPFPACFHLIEGYIADKLKARVLTLRGGMDIEDIQEVVSKLDDNIRTVVLISALFAESYDLLQCKTAYFLGRDYDPNINYQAEDRLHRINSQENVTIYYPYFENTIENEQFDVLDNKVRDVRPLYNDPELLKKILMRP